jgi:hypothetical protein
MRLVSNFEPPIASPIGSSHITPEAQPLWILHAGPGPSLFVVVPSGWILLPCRSSRHRKTGGPGVALPPIAARPRRRVTNVSNSRQERRGGASNIIVPPSRWHHRLYPRQNHFPTGTTMQRELEPVVTSGRTPQHRRLQDERLGRGRWALNLASPPTGIRVGQGPPMSVR